MPEAYWSAVQAAIWIATRDESRAMRVLVRGTSPPLRSAELPDSLYGAGLRLAVEIAYSREQGRVEPFVDVDAASIELTNKCAEGQIEVLGLLRDQGDPVAIPLSAWSFLEIRDQSPFGVIAASPNKLSTDASSWSTLRVRAEAVRLAWPPPQPQVARGYGSWALEGATYYARKARRLRRYPIQPPPPHDLAADGLPNRATTSLVEAVSWLASGRALSEGYLG